MRTTTRKQVSVHVRWMVRNDLPQILEIESELQHPWTENDVLRCLRHTNCIGMVAEVGEKIVGHMIYELLRKRLVLLRLAVNHDCRYRGVGRQLVKSLIGKLTSHHRQTLRAMIDETDLDMQLFLQRHGFVATKVLRGFCDNGEDAYQMEYTLEGP